MPTKKLSAVLEFGGKTAASFKNATSLTTREIDRIGQTIGSVAKRQAGLRKEIKRLRSAGASYKHLSRQLGELDRTAAQLERRQRRLRLVNAGLSKSYTALRRVGVRALQGIGLAAAGAAAGFAKLALDTASYGDELAKTSRRLGITVAELEELRFVGERQGVAAEVLEKSFQKSLIAIGEAVENSKGTQAKAFRALGLNVRQLQKQKPGEVLQQLAEGFSKITNTSRRNLIANRLWGEEGIKMLQVMEAGGKGIAELRDRFEELGGSIGQEGAKSAEAFSDALTDLKQQVGSTFRLVAVNAMPAITEAFKALSERLGELDIKRIGEAVGEFASMVITRGVPAVIDLAEKVGGIIDKLGGIEPVAMAVVAMFSTVFAVKAVAAIKTVTTALGGTVGALGAALTAGVKFGRWLDERFDLSNKIGKKFAELTGNDISDELTSKRGLGAEGYGIDAQGNRVPLRSKQAVGGNRDREPASQQVNDNRRTTTVHAPITIHAAPGQSEEEIGRIAAEHVKRQQEEDQAAAYAQ